MNRFLAYYYQKIKLHFLQKPLFTEKSEAPFFILSAGRSGSTLLRKLLLMNSEVNIPPETDDLIPKLIKFYLRYNHKSWDYIVKGCKEIFDAESATQFWQVAIDESDIKRLISRSGDKSLAGIIQAFYKFYALEHGMNGELWGDKTPFLTFRLSWLNLLYPHAKFVFLIRDSRAVINSFLKMNKDYSVEKASERWLKAMKGMQDQQKDAKDKMLIVRYEDLVSDTERELDKIISFLGLNRVPLQETIFLGDQVLEHHKNILQPVTTSFIDKWKEELSEKQIEKITTLTKAKLKELGY